MITNLLQIKWLDYLIYFFIFCLPFETQICTFLYVFGKNINFHNIQYILHPLSILIFLSILSFFYYKQDYKKIFYANKFSILFIISCFFIIFCGYSSTYYFIGGNKDYFWANLLFFPISMIVLLFCFARYGDIVIKILFYSYVLFSFLYILFYINFIIDYKDSIIISRYNFQYNFLMNSLGNVNKASNLLFLAFLLTFIKKEENNNWLCLFIISLLIAMFSRLATFLFFTTTIIFFLKKDFFSIKKLLYLFLFLFLCLLSIFLLDDVTKKEMYNTATLTIRFKIIESWSSYYFAQHLKNIIFGLGFQSYGILFFNKIDVGSHNLFIDFLNNGGMLSLLGLICLFSFVFIKILFNFKLIVKENILFYSSIGIFSIFILAFREYDFVYLKTQTMGGIFFILFYVKITVNK
ncbi:MAG: hypothetical protein ACRYGR_02520 [Janthinobacterium lividum]